MKKLFVTWYLTIFALITVLPLFQLVFHPFKLAGLQGAFEKGTPPMFTTKTWFGGKYQQLTDFFLKNNAGFNGELVRLRNQVDYSAFGIINTNLTLGKENYIFDPNYISAREGKDLLADSILNAKSKSCIEGLQLLDSLNIPLLFCFAPNKADFYSEFLPAASVKASTTNQEYFEKLLISKNIPIINFDSWFVSKKALAPFPLIPKYGAHWSTYGATLAIDSILKSISEIKNESLASYTVEGYEIAEIARFSDDDYLPSLNLMQKWPSPSMAYPILHFTQGKKPNVLIISDSFIWNFFDLKVIQNCFDPQTKIYYYNKTAFNASKDNLGPLPDQLAINEIKSRDCIIMIATGPSLKDFGYNFFEQLSSIKKHD